MTWFVNALLLLFVAFMSFKAYRVWYQNDKGLDIPIVKRTPGSNPDKPSGLLKSINIPPESEYDVLVSQNLFSPERTEILSDETAPEADEKSISDVQQEKFEQSLEKITLYGMVITENSAEALISDFPILPKPGPRKLISRKEKPVRQTRWIKVGDTIGDLKVAEIKPDKVILKVGSTTFDLLLYDKERIRKRTPVQPKLGPTVIGVTENVVGTKGEKEGSPPAPGIKGNETPSAPDDKGNRIPPNGGNILSDRVVEGSVPNQSENKNAPDNSDSYETFLKRTGNTKQLELYRANKEKR